MPIALAIGLLCLKRASIYLTAVLTFIAGEMENGKWEWGMGNRDGNKTFDDNFGNSY
jgi:hypothetical protein